MYDCKRITSVSQYTGWSSPVGGTCLTAGGIGRRVAVERLEL